MKITVVLGAVASAVLLFFGFIFLLSAGSVTLNLEQQVLRLVEGAILLLVGFAVAYVAYVFSRKPTTIIQQLELSGARHTLSNSLHIVPLLRLTEAR
jgi:hypothetical protein